jgi:hypothetical protein
MKRTAASLRYTSIRADQDDGSTTTAPGTKHGTLNATFTPHLQSNITDKNSKHLTHPSRPQPNRPPQAISPAVNQLPQYTYNCRVSHTLRCPLPPAETHARPLLVEVDYSCRVPFFRLRHLSPCGPSPTHLPNLCPSPPLCPQPRRSQPRRSWR